MTPADRQRLARILGMLGSDHAGERASAALQAEAFRKRHGMTWEEMLPAPLALQAEPVWTPPPEPEPVSPDGPWVSPFYLPPDAVRYAVATIIFVTFAWRAYG